MIKCNSLDGKDLRMTYSCTCSAVSVVSLKRKKRRKIILFALMIQMKSWSVLNFYIPLCGWYLFHINKKAMARIKNNEIPVIIAREDKDFPFWESFSSPVTKKVNTVFSLLFCVMCYYDTEKNIF